MNVGIKATRVRVGECVEVSKPEGTYFFPSDQRLPSDFSRSTDGSAAQESLLQAGVSYVLCNDSEVILFADHRGWNHLYFHSRPGAPGELVVSDSLFAFAGHCPIDWETLRLVPLLGYVPLPLSPVQGVTGLLPGERVTFDRLTLTERSRKSALADLLKPGERLSGKRVEEQIAESLRSATEARASSLDAPVVFLSGGFDSSLLVHLLQSIDIQPEAWTASFSSHLGQRENIRAAAAARHFGVTWRQVSVDETHVAENLRGVVDKMREPFADVATLAEAVLAKQVAAERESPSVFEGEGMDSLMCGSYKFIAERYRGILAPILALVPGGLLGREERGTRIGSLGLKLRQLNDVLKGDSLVDRHVRFLYSDSEGAQVSAGVEASVWRVFKGYYDLLPDADALTRLSCMTFFGVIPNLENRKLRLIEQFAGVKFELVYQDVDFVRLAFALPANRKVVRGYGKYAVRRAFAGALPEAVKGRAKLSFAFPVVDYFSESEIERLSDSRLVPGDSVRRAVEEHQTGRADHLAYLWGLHVANGWAQRYEEEASRSATDRA